jgi:hypothetical protein
MLNFNQNDQNTGFIIIDANDITYINLSLQLSIDFPLTKKRKFENNIECNCITNNIISNEYDLKTLVITNIKKNFIIIIKNTNYCNFKYFYDNINNFFSKNYIYKCDNIIDSTSYYNGINYKRHELCYGNNIYYVRAMTNIIYQNSDDLNHLTTEYFLAPLLTNNIYIAIILFNIYNKIESTINDKLIFNHNINKNLLILINIIRCTNFKQLYPIDDIKKLIFSFLINDINIINLLLDIFL